MTLPQEVLFKTMITWNPTRRCNAIVFILWIQVKLVIKELVGVMFIFQFHDVVQVTILFLDMEDMHHATTWWSFL
jgi:hypothetical protein